MIGDSMDEEKIIGWSWWGPVPGAQRPTDVSDGAGYTRPTLLREFTDRGYKICPLQDCARHFHNSDSYSPEMGFINDDILDVVDRLSGILIEYRWPIPGRNIGKNPTHTDLKRQIQF